MPLTFASFRFSWVHTKFHGVLLCVLLGTGACSSTGSSDIVVHDGSTQNGETSVDSGAADSNNIDTSITDSTPDSTPDSTQDSTPDSTSDGSTTDAGLLPPIDAGQPFVDSGTLAPPEWVNVDVLTNGSKCSAVTPCGGSVIGTWDVAGGCFELPIPSQLSQCPLASTQVITRRARGRVIFDEKYARRIAQSEITVELKVPAICANVIGGCSALASLIKSYAPDSACVADASSNCRCEMRQWTQIDNQDLYRTENNQIISENSSKRWGYCVAPATKLKYQDESPTGFKEPGVVTLQKR